ncbi:protein O-mannose kinase-like [Ischnura elegans]|uniref:protein O-mannose kinase-like n=1 Tax=Ischnura elegans TaxID=197161 RepID=UPI001ED87CED|nr:protein O-mannose kinase-like [Ischnura elegans]
MCDSNDLQKLLSQFLVTDELSLILNDLDAIPVVTEGGVKCGHQELKGDFVAPEQQWRLPGNFSDEDMPGYDEKTDIWKVPSVCNYFLRDVPGGDDVIMQLSSIHKHCKSVDPNLRPTAQELVSHYLAVKRNVIERDMR